MFVGIRGAGKTTAIMKYASYWKRKGKINKQNNIRFFGYY